MKWKVLLVSGCLLLCSCGARMQWMRSGTSQQEFQHDVAECKYQIQLSTPAYQPGYSRTYSQAAAQGIMDGFAEGMRFNNLMVQCMQLRGYHLEPTPEVRQPNPFPERE